MLARSKLNSIESKVSAALINNEISHEDFMIIIIEEKNYRELSYCLKCKKNTEIINPRVSKTTTDKTMMLSKCAIFFRVVKNQSLLKSNKQKDY